MQLGRLTHKTVCLRRRGLVAARPKEEPLQLLVARGTTVLEDHEKALVELCSDPTLDGKESEECIVNFLKEGYAETKVKKQPVVEAEVDLEEEEEDVVANLYNMWADDMEDMIPNGSQKQDEALEEKEKPSVKPWSSRSSPSGTFVRDPKTGAMRNIDA